MYFISKTCEYVFYLIELDGKSRADKLNITTYLYASKRAAKQWYENILENLNEDHPNKRQALEKLQEIYEDMIQ